MNSQKQQLGQRNFAFLQLHFTFMPLNDSLFEFSQIEKKNKDILIWLLLSFPKKISDVLRISFIPILVPF